MISAIPKIVVRLDITWIYQSILLIPRHKSCDTLFQMPMMVAISMYAFAYFHQIILITQHNRVAGTISRIVFISYKFSINWWMHHWVMDMTYHVHIYRQTGVVCYLISI